MDALKAEVMMEIPKSDLDAAARRLAAMQPNGVPNNRTTSVSKTTDPLPPGSSFDKAPALQEAFASAKDAQQPLERPPPQPVRRIAAADRSDLKGTSLEHVPNVRQDFTAAAQGANQSEKDQSARGSEMVKKDRPHPYPAPEDPVKTEAHRAPFDQNWSAEFNRAAASQEQIKAAAERVNAMDSQQSQRSLDRGM